MTYRGIVSNGIVGTVAALAALTTTTTATTHVMVAAELFAGARNKTEQRLIESFLASF
jgi:hypothetical protein